MRLSSACWSSASRGRYDWLPTERNLLRAIADRSALAIDRAGMTDALREREMRIAELSGHLMHAQEEERKRISRELHDETGQALMVIRLYLGMLEGKRRHARRREAKSARRWKLSTAPSKAFVASSRRLSPLVLQELGLIAAVRKEAKDLAKSAGVKARVDGFAGVRTPARRRWKPPFYRVVQEALHNVAKHANATTSRASAAARLATRRVAVDTRPSGRYVMRA